MQARTITFEVRPAVLDQVLDIIREKVLPVVLSRAGMSNALVLVDPSKARVLVLTFWESAEAMRADDTGKLMQQQFSDLSRYITAVMISEKYEVAIKAEAQPV